MGIKGVAAWVGGIAGGLVLAGVAGFYLMPRACGCSMPYNAEQLVGLSGPEISAVVDSCQFVALDVPREPLTWWTVEGEPTPVSTPTGFYLEDQYAVPVVPYGVEGAQRETLELYVEASLLRSPTPGDTGTVHIAVTDDGVVPFGVVETTWGAAYFSGACAELGLRRGADGSGLSDAEVAAWPTMTAAEIEARYGPPPADPTPITATSLEGRAADEGVILSLTLGVTGSMPEGDAVWLVTGAGTLTDEPVTGLSPDGSTVVGVRVPSGELVGVVLERDGQHFVLDTFAVPHTDVSPDSLGTALWADYTELQGVAPLGGGETVAVPVVSMARLHVM